MSTDRKLTVGMLTYDDFDGAYFTIQSLRLHHAEAMPFVEFVIIDNQPKGEQGKALVKLTKWVTEPITYVAHSETTGTALRNLVFEHAKTPYVLCLDSHVLLAPGSLMKLIEYMDISSPFDLVHGPMVSDNMRDVQTHMEPVWRDGMWGIWASDPRGTSPDSPPFEIPAMGLGLFACQRESWLGFNKRFRGFGGEECYIHEKFRRAGGAAICLPFLRWVHRFIRPMGAPYPNKWGDRVFNYLVGHQELGLDQELVLNHFRAILPEAAIQKALMESKV